MKASIAFLLCCVCLIACKKKDSILSFPAPTHSGANTLAWRIDGKDFVVNGKSHQGQGNGVAITPSNGSHWYIGAQRSEEYISLKFNFGLNPHPGSDFHLTDEYPNIGYYFNFADGTMPSGGNTYKTDSTHTGVVTITHYTSSYASGTFQMDVVNEGGSVVHITDGWFDISY